MAAPEEGAAGIGASATRGSLWLGLVNLLAKGSQVVLTVVLAGFLTEGELGLVTVAVALVNVGQVVQSMGVFDIVSRTARDPARMAGTMMTISVGIGVVLAAAGVLLAAPIAALLGAPAAAGLIRIAALSLPFTAAAGVQMGLMHRDLQFSRRLIPDGGSALVSTTVTIVLAATGHGAASLAIGLLCGAVLQPLLGVAVGVRIRPGWDAGAAMEALRWTRVVGPGAVIAILLINVDYPAVSRVLGPDAVGVYSLAFRIAWAPYVMVALVLGAVSFPVYARLRREGGELRPAVSRFVRALLVLAGAPYVIAAVMSDRVVVLDERWAPAGPVLVVLCGYGIGFALQYMLQEVVRAVDKPGAYLVLQVAHLVLLLVGLVVLTPYGVMAAAMAQFVAVWIVVPPALLVLHRAGALPQAGPVFRTVGGLVLAAGACLLVRWGTDQVALLADPTSYLGLVVDGLLMAAAFLAVMALTNRDLIRDLRHLRAG
ncbi:PST family polysaccharide transporter [Pseudonocardia sediminis]|uniref:PST family polysaccharide transporter n=1 Tax=Pseudonocardia sediminis TaxID=1397368 RepID=A0A4Q7V352_PSEST|nr:oligosaccharide flippase family protein [Pseudonocardia sediminis]RZT87924.1 PST family polysaccharide transporter [Pseudonocardia sediminis]